MRDVIGSDFFSLGDIKFRNVILRQTKWTLKSGVYALIFLMNLVAILWQRFDVKFNLIIN